MNDLTERLRGGVQQGDVAKTNRVMTEAAQAIGLLQSQLASCHAEIFKLRDQLLTYQPFFECPHCGGDLAASGHKQGCLNG